MLKMVSGTGEVSHPAGCTLVEKRRVSEIPLRTVSGSTFSSDKKGMRCLQGFCNLEGRLFCGLKNSYSVGQTRGDYGQENLAKYTELLYTEWASL